MGTFGRLCYVVFTFDHQGKLISMLPPQSSVWVYGRLAGKLEQIDPTDLIYRNKKSLRMLGSWSLKSCLMLFLAFSFMFFSGS